jgi:hypothetical protein
MGTLLRWSEHETAQQLVAYDRDVARLFTIDDV